MTSAFDIDVVIPIHNGQRFLADAINSVVTQQSHMRTNIFCVNDCSPDDSSSVVRSFMNLGLNVNLIELNENVGVAAARNIGVLAGNAPLVAFLDQDDRWVANKLELQGARFVANSELQYSVSQQVMSLVPGESLPNWCKPEWIGTPLPGWLPSSLMVRREFFNELGGFDESLPQGDVDWFSRARDSGAIMEFLEHVLVFRNVHNQNNSQFAGPSRTELLRALRKKLDGIPGK
jgi:glycosyltransferase involved in cell wall biosynthesis